MSHLPLSIFIDEYITNESKKGLNRLMNLLEENEIKLKKNIITKLFYINDKTKISDYFIKETLIIEKIEEKLKRKNALRIIKHFLKKKCTLHKKIINEMDLLYEDFENDKTLILISNNNKFSFSNKDLKNILISNLENYSEELIVSPLLPKNPYNNIDFNILQLNIIYKFLEKNNSLTKTIVLFKLSKFNINTFLVEHKTYLNKLKYFNLNKNVPNKELELKMKQYFLNLNSNYSINKFSHFIKLNNKILIDLSKNVDIFKSRLTNIISLYEFINEYVIYYEDDDLLAFYSKKLDNEISFVNEKLEIIYFSKTIKIIKYPTKHNKLSKSTQKYKKERYTKKRDRKIMDKYLDNIFTFNKELNIDSVNQKDTLYMNICASFYTQDIFYKPNPITINDIKNNIEIKNAYFEIINKSLDRKIPYPINIFK
jgi:hypothetical protein